jgi:ribosome biogenesis ATPase
VLRDVPPGDDSMSKPPRPCSDARLPHRIQDWAEAHGGRATEADADAIVSWLRSQRSLEYGRKPADGLRRQVLRLLERSAAAASPVPGALQIGGAGSACISAAASWSIDASPDPVAAKRAALPGSADVRSAKAARIEVEAAAAPPRDFNLLNATVAKSYRAQDADAVNGTSGDVAPAADGSGDAPAADAATSDAAASTDAANALSAPGKKRPRRDRRASPAATEAPTVSYADLGGMEGPLQAVRELVEYPLTHPEIFAHLGVAPPRGLLLHGPPGCGKTLLACAIAGELGVGFVRVSAPEVVSGMSGESEAKIRQIFKEAREAAPALLFIDEIDAIAPKREAAQREMEKRIVAQMLTCMDELAAAGGSQFDSAAANGQSNPTVIVIGATNRPDALDPALRRAGRFDREIALGIPDAAARGRILQVRAPLPRYSLVLERYGMGCSVGG